MNHPAVGTDTYTARALNIRGSNVYFIVIQLAATAVMFVGQLAVVVKSQLSR
jgi:hypothetical protein